MSRFPGIRRLFRLPFHDVKQLERDVDDELRFHLDRRIEELVAKGMMPDKAREEVLRQFGDLEHTRRYCHRVSQRREGRARRRQVAEGLWQELRIGFRTLRRSPGFTFVAVFSLALGIGGTTAIFSVLYAVILRPLPYPEPDRLVQVFASNPEMAARNGWPYAWMEVSPLEYRHYQEHSTVFQEMGWIKSDVREANLLGGDRPEQVTGVIVSASLFSVLGIEPMLGRVWLPEEDGFTGDGSRVAILNHGLWQRLFGSDPTVVGRTINLDTWPHTIVGVMPPGFQIPPRPGAEGGTVEAHADYYVPVWEDVDRRPPGWRRFQVVARLRAGIDPAQAQAEMSTLAAGLAEAYPESNKSWTVRVIPFKDLLAVDLGPQMALLMAAVGLVLVIACANVANLLLARGTARSGEMAIRAAIGGGRLRLIRQLLIESLILAGAAGGAGLLLAYWGDRVLIALLPASVPRAGETGIDGTVLVFSVLVAVGTGVVFGLVPAFRTSRVDLGEAMRGTLGRLAGPRGRGGVSRALVAGEVALALVLLVSAGLLVRSFVRLASADPGYDPKNVLVVALRVGLPSVYNTGYYSCDLNQGCEANLEEMRRYFREVVQGVERVSGVESAALTTMSPLTTLGWNYPLFVEREPDGASPESPSSGASNRGRESVGSAVYKSVDPGYFHTMGIRLLAGRSFREDDFGRRVVIINETLARRVSPDGDPLGKRIAAWSNPPRTVIGIVEDAQETNLTYRVLWGMRVNNAYALFDGRPGMDLMVRTRGDPTMMVEPIREAILEVDADLPAGRVTTLEQMAFESNATPRLYALLIGIFAGFALLLAAVGLYGVVAFTVGQRTKEIGLRMALGATSARVKAMFVGHAMGSVAAGVILGAIGLFALMRVLDSFLYGMDPVDPVTLVSVAAVLAAVAIGASYLPARRASRLDPVDALRSE